MSQVFIHAALQGNHVHWQGESDALITKGLLALLIKGMSDLTPDQVLAVDPAFIAATGLQASLTPSRANGFLNILRIIYFSSVLSSFCDFALFFNFFNLLVKISIMKRACFWRANGFSF